MGSNRLALAALSAVCIAAAAGGGYFATRQNAPVPVLTATSAAPDSTINEAPQPVQETEAVVGALESTKPVPPARREVTPRAAASARPVKPSAPAKANTPEPPRTWSSTSVPLPTTTEPSASATSASDATAAATSRDEEPRASDATRAPEPPAKTFEELVVSADSVLGLQMETAVSSERAKVEDRVEARVVRDVRVGGAVAIPAGSRAIGSVMTVERGGKVKERARLGIRFHTLVLADGTRLPITTETLYRNGEAPANASAAKIGGGAAAGAILGAIIGGAKGAAIGGTVGAGAGTAVVMNGDRSAATFPAGTDVTARILSPVTVTVEK
jgi:type IV secretory pathway VirB10-like protein